MVISASYTSASANAAATQISSSIMKNFFKATSVNGL